MHSVFEDNNARDHRTQGTVKGLGYEKEKIMLKKILIVSTVLAVSLSFASTSFAKPPHKKFAGPKHHSPGKHHKVGNPKHNPKVNTPWEAKADKNGDGFVGPKENKMWKKHHAKHPKWKKHHAKHPKWKKRKKFGKHPKHPKKHYANGPKVNTPWEAKADRNNDGFVDAKEKRMWKKSHNGPVDTPLEHKIDANNNGHIEKIEIKKHTS